MQKKDYSCLSKDKSLKSRQIKDDLYRKDKSSFTLSSASTT